MKKLDVFSLIIILNYVIVLLVYKTVKNINHISINKR